MTINQELNYYPFVVSERNEEGKFQLAKFKECMHGFGIVTEHPVHAQLFERADEEGAKFGSDVYEIRVKNETGDWQDWQAIIGDIRIVPHFQWALDVPTDDVMDMMKERFNENFQIRYSGTLWRTQFGDVSIFDEKMEMSKRINPFTLQIEYNSDLDNYCISFKQHRKQQKKFRKRYYAQDEQGNRF